MIKIDHCPGFEQFRHAKSLSFRCPYCQNEEEVFSDEIEKHLCSGCNKKVDINHYMHSEDLYQFDMNRVLLR